MWSSIIAWLLFGTVAQLSWERYRKTRNAYMLAMYWTSIAMMFTAGVVSLHHAIILLYLQ
jgi:hypothetical protein